MHFIILSPRKYMTRRYIPAFYVNNVTLYITIIIIKTGFLETKPYALLAISVIKLSNRYLHYLMDDAVIYHPS